MARFYGRRRDANHFEVIRMFERLGCTVIDVSQTPCGFDILVGYGGLTMPVEIKNPNAARGKKQAKKLTDNEKRIHDRWTGGIRLVMTADDVAETANTLRKWHKTLLQHLVNSCAASQPRPSSPP